MERQLSEPQRIRVAGAYRKAGPQAVEGFRKVLLGIIAGDEDRRRFDRRAARPAYGARTLEDRDPLADGGEGRAARGR